MSEQHPAEPNVNANDTPNSSANSSANWYSGWEDFADAAETDGDVASSDAFPSSAEQEWHPVNPPNAMPVSALEQADQVLADLHGGASGAASPSPSPTQASSDQEIDLPNWSTRTLPPQSSVAAMNPPLPPNPSSANREGVTDAVVQPDVAELVSLIQELNQCNSALLDRVAHLEDALEQAQTNEGDRPTSPMAFPSSVSNAQASPSAEQVAQVFQELEGAHQTTQRQQILIETLTEQFNQSQQRVAHLETECASLQQRAQAQSQQLQQSEATCQDLHMRLQRQQRYTLQFKAALERCLEVSNPAQPSSLLTQGAVAPGTTELNPGATTDAGAIAAFAAPPPAPRVPQIQPWSAPNAQRGLPTKLDTFLGTSLPADLTPPTDLPAPSAAGAPVASTTSINAVPSNAAPLPPSHLAAADSSADTAWQNDPEVQASSNALQAAALEFRSLITNLLGGEADASSTAADPNPTRQAPSSDQPTHPATAQTVSASQLAQESALPSVPSKPRLSMPKEIFQQAANAVQTATESDAPDLQTHTGTTPAPRVYPFRPLKKIDSVAAVDLPTFPHPG
ncbi:MAG: hypothetical protein AAFX78_15485 [Cyanobacteria bacterium J06638_20]